MFIASSRILFQATMQHRVRIQQRLRKLGSKVPTHTHTYTHAYTHVDTLNIRYLYHSTKSKLKFRVSVVLVFLKRGEGESDASETRRYPGRMDHCSRMGRVSRQRTVGMPRKIWGQDGGGIHYRITTSLTANASHETSDAVETVNRSATR